MKTIFISGKISGLKMQVVEKAFNYAKKQLEKKGYNVINPVELCKDISPENKTEKEYWNACMKRCLSTIEKWDGIYFIDNWTRDSVGAAEENRNATLYDIPRYYNIESVSDNE